MDPKKIIILYAILLSLIAVTSFAQPYRLEIDWEYTYSGDIDINSFSYEDKYGPGGNHKDADSHPNNQRDLDRECRKMNSIIPDAIEAIETDLSNDQCSDLMKKVVNQIAKNNLEEAFNLLGEKLSSWCIPKELILLESRFNRAEQYYSCGMVVYSEYDVLINRVTFALLGTLDDIIAEGCCN